MSLDIILQYHHIIYDIIIIYTSSGILHTWTGSGKTVRISMYRSVLVCTSSGLLANYDIIVLTTTSVYTDIDYDIIVQ